MVEDVILLLALIGTCWAVAQARRALRFVIADRSGNSGRAKHWTED